MTNELAVPAHSTDNRCLTEQQIEAMQHLAVFLPTHTYDLLSLIVSTHITGEDCSGGITLRNMFRNKTISLIDIDLTLIGYQLGDGGELGLGQVLDALATLVRIGVLWQLGNTFSVGQLSDHFSIPALSVTLQFHFNVYDLELAPSNAMGMAA
jgi:hypothetical protein